MAHLTHSLKSYAGDPGRRLIFCAKCGKEEDEGLNEPCTGKFYAKEVDTKSELK